jgi:hypothetical protein
MARKKQPMSSKNVCTPYLDKLPPIGLNPLVSNDLRSFENVQVDISYNFKVTADTKRCLEGI